MNAGQWDVLSTMVIGCLPVYCHVNVVYETVRLMSQKIFILIFHDQSSYDIV